MSAPRHELRSMPCPNAAAHADEPKGYLAWMDWASRMHGRGNKQSRCSGCDLYKIWRGPDFQPETPTPCPQGEER